MASIKCGHCRQTHTSVLEVKQCSQRPKDAAARPTIAQITEPTSGAALKVIRAWQDGQDVSGMYRYGGEIYKVQIAVHGSGRPYAKRLVVVEEDGQKTGKFEIARGTIYDLVMGDKMSLGDAKEFGLIYGVCCKCGRTLTDDKSIADGIGPVCASKGW